MAAREIINQAITIDGVVQGVGFRPFVAKLAAQMGIRGFVRNEGGRVYIEAAASMQRLRAFVQAIEGQCPTGSAIIRVQVETLPRHALSPGFTIEKSKDTADGFIMPSPDLAICEDCLKELFQPDDPRYLNPFISCTHCGPRYSIMRALPYDRQATTMAQFPLCALCHSQYTAPDDRRYHAQTICCNQCGPKLVGSFRGIAAIKGIGGYHLACSPFDEGLVSRLRAIKGREHKPFAVMFENLTSLKEYCEVTEKEEALLLSGARPIVLLKRKESAIVQSVYSTSPYLGAFLPYTPLQHLVLRQTGPLVMTSANASSQPIIIDDAQMHAFPGVDCVISHNRDILRRLDDSVVQVIDNQTQFLRRARGYVPLAVSMKGTAPMIALGAQEKNTFCLFQGGYAFLSQENGDIQEAGLFEATLKDMAALLKLVPEKVICDKHPYYVTTDVAKTMGLPILQVQHHHAHIASVMAEHGLRQVLGVAFDGTGYGDDGSIWGGEFLLVDCAGYQRLGHLKAIQYLGGDESVKQGWKSALCLMEDAGIPYDNPLVHAALQNNINTHESSSMGRLFDGISALLGICTYAHYSGQPAIELENAAAKALLKDHTPFTVAGEDFAPCVRELYALYRAGAPVNELAYRFHVTVACWIASMCEGFGFKQVALSGGVFQNRLLVELVEPMLTGKGFAVFRNHLVPPGDGGLSLGQMWIGQKGEEDACV